MATSRVRHDGDVLDLTTAAEEAARPELRNDDLLDVRASTAEVPDALDPEILAAAQYSLQERAADYEYLAQ